MVFSTQARFKSIDDFPTSAFDLRTSFCVDFASVCIVNSTADDLKCGAIIQHAWISCSGFPRIEGWSIFSERHRLEKGSGEDWSRFFIYEENQHFDVIGRSSDDVIQKISKFIHDEADE